MKAMRSLLMVVLALAVLALAATAMVRANGEIPRHPHMLVLGLEFGPTGITYKKCVDLAHNQPLPLNAHHEHVHFGKAGEALRTNAGHFAIPAAPFSDINNCAHLAELFGPPR